jgi:hypothetical protein
MYKTIGIAALFVASASAACWSDSLGYPCCSSADIQVVSEDSSGKWGIENNNWCGIPKETCWAEALGYSCCPSGTPVSYTDASGDWGYVNDWCGIVKSTKTIPTTTKQIQPTQQKCWSEPDYPCCKLSSTRVEYTDASGSWGIENGNWCGIVKSSSTTTRRTTTTTVRTTTTTRKVKPTYSVIYEIGGRLNTGYDNWGWDSSLTFKDGSMVVTADKGSYGAASIKNTKKDFGVGGSIRFDVKSKGKLLVKVESTEDKEVAIVGTTDGGESDFKTYIFDIDYDGPFDRINLQDSNGNGDPIYIRYLIYSTGSADDFVDPIDTSRQPVVTTRKNTGRATYTTIFRTTSSMPNGYDDWGWGCNISYSGGAMVITPEEGEYGALSLKRISGYFKGGSIRFDMKNEGKVNVMVENSDTDDKITVKSINPSSSYETYILDVDFGSFDRINFQDARGDGSRIWIKNLVHSTGYADEFVDPI